MIRTFLQKLADAGPSLWGLLLAGPIVTALTIYFAQSVREPVPGHSRAIANSLDKDLEVVE